MRRSKPPPQSSPKADFLRRYLAGARDADDEVLERRVFGAAARGPDETLAQMLTRLGLHKFDEDPPNYRVVRAMLELLPRPGATVLDVGCGRGRVLLCAATAGARRATGIEIVEYRAQLARRAASRLGLDRVRVIEGDALALAWPKAEILVLMNPFYPSAHRRLRGRLVDYARAHRPLIVAASTLRDRLAADRGFRLQDERAVEWIRIGAFVLRE